MQVQPAVLVAWQRGSEPAVEVVRAAPQPPSGPRSEPVVAAAPSLRPEQCWPLPPEAEQLRAAGPEAALRLRGQMSQALVPLPGARLQARGLERERTAFADRPWPAAAPAGPAWCRSSWLSWPCPGQCCRTRRGSAPCRGPDRCGWCARHTRMCTAPALRCSPKGMRPWPTASSFPSPEKLVPAPTLTPRFICEK